MNQVERRNAIKEILFSDRNAQIQNLADRFGVSVRTIKYDIEALTCSYPIETVRGRYGGGVKLADWYHPSKKALSPEQMALLKKLAPTLEGDDSSWHQLRRLRRGRRVRRLHGDGCDHLSEEARAGAGRRVRAADPRQSGGGAEAAGEPCAAELRAHRGRQLLCADLAEHGCKEAGRGAQGQPAPVPGGDCAERLAKGYL